MMVVEVLAIIFVVFALLTIGILLTRQKSCYNITKKTLKHRKLFGVLAVLILLVVGLFLFQEMNAIQIAAAAVFVLLLEAVSFFTCSNYDELVEMKKKELLKKDIVKKNWFSALLWTLFALFVLYKLVV